jgi:hypothetical protein
MNTPENKPRSESLTFSGFAALLLLIGAFCVYPFGATTPATFFAGLAFLCLALATPGPDADRVPARVRVHADSRPRDAAWRD